LFLKTGPVHYSNTFFYVGDAKISVRAEAQKNEWLFVRYLKLVPETYSTSSSCKNSCFL